MFLPKSPSCALSILMLTPSLSPVKSMSKFPFMEKTKALSKKSFSIPIPISFFWQNSGLLRMVIGHLVSVTKRLSWSETIQLFTFLLPCQNVPFASFSGCAYVRNIQAQTLPKMSIYECSVIANHSKVLWPWADVCNGAVWDTFRECLKGLLGMIWQKRVI